MELNDYQKMAYGTAQYPDRGFNLLYPALGLVGEAGETADKIKKFWRNHGITNAVQLSDEQKEALAKEVGDVLWYIAALASELSMDLSDIASMNLRKLYGRVERGTIKSEGDDR